MKLFQTLAEWESNGKPKGATYTIGLGTEKRPIEELFSQRTRITDSEEDYWYQDPPEQWLDVEPVMMLIKFRFGATIRCRPKPASLDDAWDEWASLDGLLITDIFKFDFQYLSKV